MLTREEARARSAVVSGVEYLVSLDLTRSDEVSGCDTIVRFQAGTPGVGTFLDFAPTSVDHVECNGEVLGPDAVDGARIHLPVREGDNECRVVGTVALGRTGVGLHDFRDPEDGNHFVHTKFEPFDAHRVYPCFDQPDLKGSFTLAVAAPPAWTVVSNAPGSPSPGWQSPGWPGRLSPGSPSTPARERRQWVFAPTPPLPPYLTALVAGPFARIASPYPGLPVNLYARPSLLDAVSADADELFELVRQGLAYYANLFGWPYPFAKYDQAFVPEYGFGGMEHPGCVTLNESFVFRSRATDDARRRRAQVLLHEMAHMWFGDLVTMRWWDDLWLNESFATLLATAAQAEATRFAGAWVNFAHEVGPPARAADRLPTNHPVVADVPDTDAVRLQFDAITYRKGATVLRQLATLVGREPFTAGLRRYVRRHAWANADLRDFLAAIEEAAGWSLSGWAAEWLEQPGVTIVEARLSLDAPGEPVVEAEQRPGGPGALRVEVAQHPGTRRLRLRVGLYGPMPATVSDQIQPATSSANPGTELARRAGVDLELRGAATATMAEGSRPLGDGPVLVLPNDDDSAYAEVRFDDRSLHLALDRLSGLPDPLARAVVWGSLWDGVLDARLPARSFVACVVDHAPAEEDVGITELLWERARQAAVTYGDPDNALTALAALSLRARRALDTASPGSDGQLAWARAWVSTAAAPTHLDAMEELLATGRRWPGLLVDSELRWLLVTRLATADRAGEETITGVLATDRSDEGQRRAVAARAARPHAGAKEEAWRKATGSEASLALRRAAMAGMCQPGQEALLGPYATPYFDSLDRLWRESGPDSGLAFARLLYPRLAGDEDRVLALADRLVGEGRLPAPLLRVLREEGAKLAGAVAARAHDAGCHGSGRP